MPIFFKPSASDFSLSADSIGNRWLQEPVVRPNGFPLYHWIQTERGEGLLTLKGQELLLKPGDGVLIAPHVPHEYRENDGSGMWFTSFLTFDGKFSDDLYKICAVSPYLFVPASEGAWFQEWIDRIIDSHFLKNDIDDAALSVGCFEFLTRLSQLRTGLSRDGASAVSPVCPPGNAGNRKSSFRPAQCGCSRGTAPYHAAVSDTPVPAFCRQFCPLVHQRSAHQPRQGASHQPSLHYARRHRRPLRLPRCQLLYLGFPPADRDNAEAVPEAVRHII